MAKFSPAGNDVPKIWAIFLKPSPAPIMRWSASRQIVAGSKTGVMGVPAILAFGWYLPNLLRWSGRKLFRKRARSSSRSFVWICRAGYLAFLLLLLKTL